MNPLEMPSTATDYIEYRLTGGSADPSGIPIEIGFAPVSPTGGQGAIEYYEAAWVELPVNSDKWYARILLGPGDADSSIEAGVVLAAGTYQVYLKYTASPVQPVKPLGPLVILPY